MQDAVGDAPHVEASESVFPVRRAGRRKRPETKTTSPTAFPTHET